jgi:hypothetical protein
VQVGYFPCFDFDHSSWYCREADKWRGGRRSTSVFLFYPHPNEFGGLEGKQWNNGEFVECPYAMNLTVGGVQSYGNCPFPAVENPWSPADRY